MTHISDAIREVTVAMQQAIADGRRGGLFRTPSPSVDGPIKHSIPRRRRTPDRGRSRMIDADDLVEVLLAIADRLDPPVRDTANEVIAPCPDCGMADADRLVWIDDEFPGADKFVRCDACGTIFDPSEGGP